MPAGRRRDALAMAIEAILSEDFEGRILPFESDAAREHADIAAAQRGADGLSDRGNRPFPRHGRRDAQ